MSATPTPSARSICVTVRLYWKRSDGTPYAYLSALPRALEGEAGRLLFATNAGMFDPALKPVGLYVEQGRELIHVNTRSGYGNFHMKPNGVFYISADRAAVAETRAFLKQRPQAELATQSGPLLVINGRLHPRFDRSSTSLKARNGVGVRADGKVILASAKHTGTMFRLTSTGVDGFATICDDGTRHLVQHRCKLLWIDTIGLAARRRRGPRGRRAAAEHSGDRSKRV
jgi:uncharacterized protein YigE (DUF2233 family)